MFEWLFGRRETKMMGHYAATIIEDRRNGRYLDTHTFHMFVPKINGEHVPSWVHEFTEASVYFALVDMKLGFDCKDLTHILACLTAGAHNLTLNKYWSADKTWERREDINFSIEDTLPSNHEDIRWKEGSILIYDWRMKERK